MEKISNKEKLEALKGWLKENDLEFEENHQSRFGFNIDLKVKKLRIAVFLSDGDREKESAIYHAKSKKAVFFNIYHPFFIRESESKEFVLEKIQNCCYDCMMMLQRRFENQNKKK